MASTTRAMCGQMAALLLLFGTSGGADAQVLMPAELEGSYRLLPERSDDVARVVEQATSRRSWPAFRTFWSICFSRAQKRAQPTKYPTV